MQFRARLRSSLALLLPGAFCLSATCVFGCGVPGNQTYNPTLSSGPGISFNSSADFSANGWL